MQDVLMHAYKFATDAEGINEIVENPTQLADFVTDFHPFGVRVPFLARPRYIHAK